MVITVMEIPSYRIAYIRKVGPYGTDNRKMMESLKAWAGEEGLLTDEAVIFGIAQDDPRAVEPESCRYDVCLALANDYPVKEGPVSVGHIPGGNYAVFRIEHTTEAIMNAWTVIFTELAKRHLRADETRPILERYAAKLVKAHNCELCVPIL